MDDQRKSENACMPALRFEGFTDPWEQRKLGELYESAGRKNAGEFNGDRIISVANMRFSPAERELSQGYLETYNVMDLGDIAFEGNRSKYFAHGRFVENDIGAGIVSHVFDVFKPKGSFDLMFWKYYINNERVMGPLLVRATKASTMMHNLVKSDFLAQALSVPSIPEQQAIGAFFAKIDSLITLHQRKHDKLKTVKQSLLEKMFPKEGESEPEIRFEGFTDPWEQRKLGEVAILSSAARVHKDEWVAEGVPFLRSSNVVASFRGETAEQLYISEELYGRLSKRSGKLNKGDILLTGGGSIGIPYLIPDESDVYSKDADLLWVKTNGRTDPIFLYWQYAAPSMRCYLGGVSHVGTIAHYTIEQAKETPIVLPDTDEQKIIGSFFQRLDSLITLHQRELDVLKNLKQALLEKMFV